jgi:HlyD family secretion protein
MKRIVLIVFLLAAAGAAGWWWYNQRDQADKEFVLYGNVDIRQIQLAFNNSERIASVDAKEGDSVPKGKLLAELDASRLIPQVAQAKAQADAQRAVVAKLHNGTRPEEIAQAIANLASAKADAANARRQYERLKNLTKVSAASQEDADNAEASLDVADAKLIVQQQNVALAVLGPRQEEIAEAEARLRANEAQLAFLKQQLNDTELRAPQDAVVRSRLMEPGEMASPLKPVFSLAILTPKWVRAYVSETDLGKVQKGMTAYIVVDSYPGRRFEGWVGFISPVAEFTPKAVQTEELRTSLVYEVRVFVNDPANELRLGMPATVYLPK